MCQAYEAERNYIQAGEDYNIKRGYEAHTAGQPRSANPNYNERSYDWKAWDHGWACRAENFEPYVVEQERKRREVVEARKLQVV